MQNFCSKLFVMTKKTLSTKTIRWKSKKPEKNQKYSHLPDPSDYSPDFCDKLKVVYPSEPEKASEEPKVVIIGAGVAGLAAAAHLVDHGIDNFLILEATERPGGRILSKKLGDVPVELGSHYKPETTCNHPVFEMWARDDPPQPGLPATAHSLGLFDRVTYGKPPSPTIISAYYKLRAILKEAEYIFGYGANKAQGSLVNFVGIRIQQELHAYPEEFQHDAARIMFGMAHVLNSRSPTDNGWLAEDNMGVYLHMPGSKARVPLGLVGMLAPLLRKINSNNIKFCKPVQCIYWGALPEPTCRALVTTCDGDEYEADYVITTVSVGVLQRYPNMFCPTLPYEKINAISKLKMCHCNKIYLEFCRPFATWKNTVRNVYKLQFTEEERSSRYDWTRGITAIESAPHSDHILCVWVCGPEAAEMEKLCDGDIVEGVRNILCPEVGFNIPYPVSVLKSSWTKNRFFYGAGVRICNPEQECCQQQLAQPVPGPDAPVQPILLFAGEATTPGLSATVAGARISGIREAERVRRFICYVPRRKFKEESEKAEKAEKADAQKS